MLLLDVNVLVYAHREEVPRHAEYRSWLEELIESGEAFGVADLVLSGFLRIVTHPKIFKQPSPQDGALAFVEEIRSQPSCPVVKPGARHWGIFLDVCRETSARGNLIPDAYLPALAVESDCTWVTTDGDYADFSGLDWRHPLDGGPSGP